LNVVRGVIVTLLLFLNLVLWGTLIFVCGILKVLTRGELRRRVTLLAAWLGEQFVRVNSVIYDALLPTRWNIQAAEGLDRNGHYLIFSNHRSWTDILVIFRAFHRRTALVRFFLKAELVWFPVVGQASWALDFPFMRRYSAEYLAKHPEKRGKDLETTRRACRRYRRVPVAILNFLEGTRFTAEKHEEQQSPYANLLRPRVGGAGFVLASLGDQLDGVIDVAIQYSEDDATIWDFVCGRIAEITVHMRELDVPPEFYSTAIVDPGPARDRFRAWIEKIWSEKDAILRTED
jgi:1-acyl-sn-glycerol-3-phosphate acyltransferase